MDRLMTFLKLPKYLILFLLAFSLHFAAFAQLKLADFSYSYFPSSGIKDSPLNQEVELSEYKFSLNFPKKLKDDKTVLINGLQYKLVTLSSEDNFNFIASEIQQLHSIGYSLIIVRKMVNDWQFLLFTNPILSSTFNTSLEGDDFLFTGSVQFIKEKSERFSYGGGIVATYRFGNPRLLPALQFIFTQPKSELRIILPNQITYERFYGKLTAGLQMAVDGSRYNSNFYRVNSTTNESELVSDFGYTRVVLGPTLKYRIGKMLQLEASGGLVGARRVEFQGDIENEQFIFENGAFFQVGVSLILPEKEED